MSRVQEFINKIKESQAKMLQIVERIDPEKKVYPEWKIKQVLAHLAGWDEAVTRSIKSFLGDGTPELAAYQGVDVYNANSVSTREDLPLAHVIREYQLERQKLEEVLKQLLEEQLESEIIYPWGGEGSIYRLVSDMSWHERNHAKEIEEVLDGKRKIEDEGH